MYKVMNWKGFILIMAVILIAFFLLLFPLLEKRSTQNESTAAGTAKLNQVTEENQNLIRLKEQMGTDEYIAARAIQGYDYIKRDDIPFEIVNPDALYHYTEEESRILMQEIAE